MPGKRPKESKDSKAKRNSPIHAASRSATEFFSKLTDIEFFSSCVTHIYFYGTVTRESVLNLKLQIREANRDVVLAPNTNTNSDPTFVSPKPIVIHVNSFGGDAHSMHTIYSAFLESKMPICALVDGVSASASTILSAGAPYRVVAPSSSSLFHEWSANFTHVRVRKPDLDMLMKKMEIHDKGYYAAVQPKSKLSNEDLDSLVKHDLFLNTSQMLKKGFADRLLKFDRGKDAKMSISGIRELLRDPSVNHITIMPESESKMTNDVDPVVLELDRILQLDSATRKSIAIHFNQSYSDDSSDHMVKTFYGQMVPLLTRVRAVSSDGPNVVGVVDSIIDVITVIPFLHCNVRAMYESAIFVIHLVYGSSSVQMIDDDIENTKNAFLEVKKLLSERTRLPKKMIDDMHRTRIVMSAQQCLQYGITDVLL